LTTMALDALTLPLDPAPLDPRNILAGNPAVSWKTLWRSPDGRSERGIWQITPGTVSDVEVDEMFVVLTGKATVTVEGGPTLVLAPGSVGMLTAGDRTVWQVTETLRKAYQLSRSDVPSRGE